MKKKFRFKLVVVQDLRKREEDLALKKLAETQNKFQSLVTKKSNLFKQLEETLLKRENLSNQDQNIHSFLLHNDFIIGCKVRIFQMDQVITKARKNVEKALREYIIAKRKTRALETLYEKAFAEYKKELSKKEQKDNEDLYTVREYLIRQEKEEEALELAEEFA